MYKKNILLIIFVCFSQIIFSQENYYKPKYSTSISHEKGKKLIRQCSRYYPENVQNYFDLENADIQNLELNFKKVYELKSKKCCILNQKINKLDYYGFQYIGIIIENHKYVYINAFDYDLTKEFMADFDNNWKTEPVIICDGGGNYWGVLFDLEKKEFIDLSFNGSL